MNNKNGRKTFLKIHLQKHLSQKLINRILAITMLFTLLSVNCISVLASTTLEEDAEISDNSQSNLNITDDDCTNGNLLYDFSLSYNNDAFRDTFVTNGIFTNGIVSTFEREINADRNLEVNRNLRFRYRYSFFLADNTKMMSKGSDFTLSLSGLYNGFYAYNLSDELVGFDYLGASGLNVSNTEFYLYISLFDIDGNSEFFNVPVTRINCGYKELSFDSELKDIPFDVYKVIVGVSFFPSKVLPEIASFLGSDNYYLVTHNGFVNSKFSITESLYNETNEKLDAINDNLDDIWARLVAIYDMVEDGFGAIVTLFYDLMDFLSGEFDDLIQTIINQATETRNTIVTQFTNLTNKLSTWFTNLTNTITTQFSNLTTNLRTWYNGLTSTLNVNFQNLFDQNEEQHEETINGYDDTTGANRNDEVQGSINDFNSSQGEIMDDMNDNLDEFTLPSNGLIGYAVQFTTTFPLVAGMMQSVFDSSGQFGLILSVIFAMTIFTMVIGLYKYYKD